jgi:hypothetical protein
MSFMMGTLGYDKETAAAFTAGLMGESGRELNPKSFNPNDPGGAYGTAQWVGSRKEKLFALAKQMGKPWYDVSVQQEMFRREATGPYKKALDFAAAGKTPEEKLRRYIGGKGWGFESPAFNNWRQRAEHLPSLLKGQFSRAETAATQPTSPPTSAQPIPSPTPPTSHIKIGESEYAATRGIPTRGGRSPVMPSHGGIVTAVSPTNIPAVTGATVIPEVPPWSIPHRVGRWAAGHGPGSQGPGAYGQGGPLVPGGRRNPYDVVASRDVASDVLQSGTPTDVQLGRGQVDLNVKLDRNLSVAKPQIQSADQFDVGVAVDRTGTFLARPGDPSFHEGLNY